MTTHHGKKYEAAMKELDSTRLYQPAEAVSTAKKAAFANFDESVEIHLRMGVDIRNASQQVRGVALLPHGLGKQVRVLVFAQGEAERSAREAGADYIGNEELIKKIEGGWTEFDVAMATPDMMGKIGKLGKVLGRKGLMPNPKAGTVVQPGDLPRVIDEARKGRVEFKLDKTNLIHVIVGKKSFEDDKLVDNLMAVVDAIVKAKPAGAKGTFIKSVSLSTTMGPGFKLDLKPLNAS
ncbi:MAG: 50S ribosomal protein L1 [Dehalococcoidales bacterium]|nr:50S ribosomal protein L1 [Dehalococcoidales bacterium]